MNPIVPMEPSMSTEIPKGEAWTFQIKWDGVRVLLYADGRQTQLFNRKLRERTLHYPEIANPADYTNSQSIILDGEVIAFGENGKPSFHEVMRRDGLRRLDKVPIVSKSVPVTYMVFDILYLNGEWMTMRPLRDRIGLLQDTLRPHPHVQVVTNYDDGETLFDVMQQHGMEGIVAKQLDSPYRIGEKRDSWLKVKNYRDVNAVIGGFTVRDGLVNAVMLGLYNEREELIYVGHTGTGKLSHEEWKRLAAELLQMRTPERPFKVVTHREKEANWVLPRVAVKVKFAEWTPGGLLRQPSIQGVVRIEPRECRFE